MKADRINRIIEGGIAVMLVAFCSVLYLSLHDNVVEAGDRAPDFSVKTDSGKVITAHNFGGKLLVLNFWASWCEPCVAEAPSLNKLQQVLGPDGLVVLGISQDKDPQAYQSFLSHFNIDYQTARQPDAATQTEYGTFKIPETYIINTKGKVVEKIISDTDWASPTMIEHVKSLL